MPLLIGASIISVAGIALGITGSVWAFALVVVGLLAAYDTWRLTTKATTSLATLNESVLSALAPAGTSADRMRLITVVDRLTATFGLDAVSCFIVNDPAINACVVPVGASWALYVTSGAMHGLELIELEGVVAHCFARIRTGAVTRLGAAATLTGSPESLRELAGHGVVYRADEVAAAAIRYPLGLAGALRKAATPPSGATYFTGATYQRQRWIWFNVYADAASHDLGDLDDVTLRAMALEEW
jgi:Zn-dependent protease with chaperone function